MVDINKLLRSAVNTGKVQFGVKQTTKAIKSKKAKLIVTASNCSPDYLKTIQKQRTVPVYNFKGTNVELGAACGKPFSISTLVIVDEGNSNIVKTLSD
jgi:large subunit ribosomal protein L30e